MATKYRAVNMITYTSPGNVLPMASATNNPLTSNAAIAIAASTVAPSANVEYTTATTFSAANVETENVTITLRELPINPNILTSFGLQNEVRGTVTTDVGGVNGIHLSTGIWTVNVRTRLVNTTAAGVGADVPLNELILWFGEFPTNATSPYLFQIWSNSTVIAAESAGIVDININIIVPVLGQHSPFSLSDFHIYLSGPAGATPAPAYLAGIEYSQNSAGPYAEFIFTKMNTPVI